MNIITIDPRPASHDAMVEVLKNSAPVYGVEFTLPKLAHLLATNIDGQHNAQGGQAAIEVARGCAIPPHTATYAVVRPDPDALGAIALLETRHEGLLECGDDDISIATNERVNYIAQHDAFQFGAWPGPQDPRILNQEDRLLFSALSAICMDFKSPIEERVNKMRSWLETGTCDGLDVAIAEVRKTQEIALNDIQIVEEEGNIAVVKAHTLGAAQIAYCYAPVAVIENDAFTFPKVEGKHLKYTICQYEAGKYVDLPATAIDLNKLEQSGGSWGGSPAIIGSPQGVSSSLSLSQVTTIVKIHLI